MQIRNNFSSPHTLAAHGMAPTQGAGRSAGCDAVAGKEHLRRWFRCAVDVSG